MHFSIARDAFALFSLSRFLFDKIFANLDLPLAFWRIWWYSIVGENWFSFGNRPGIAFFCLFFHYIFYLEGEICLRQIGNSV